MGGVRTKLFNRGDVPELSISSLPEFNEMTWGLRVGLTVIGARTSMGKSSFALQIAHDIADSMQEVLYLSLEMSADSLIERLFCNIEEVDNEKLLKGYFKNSVEYQDKWESFCKITKIPLKISAVLGKDLDDINKLIAILNPKPRLIIVDLVQAINKNGASNERLVLDKYILNFRDICILNNIAGIIVSQNSRKVFDKGADDKNPSLENLKGTGCLEESAESVFLLSWPHFFNPEMDRNIYKIIVAKQRDGRIGEHLVNFNPEYYKFSELSEAQKFKLREEEYNK